MPKPSAIWVCDSPNCCRILRKRGPTNSFLPDSPAIAAPICDKNYKVTFITRRYVTSHHHSHTSPLYEIRSFAFSFRHVSQRTVTNVDTDVVRICRHRRDHGYELPATWDQRFGHPGASHLSKPNRSSRSPAQGQGHVEWREGRSRGPHALAEPLQDRPRCRALHGGADARRYGGL